MKAISVEVPKEEAVVRKASSGLRKRLWDARYLYILVLPAMLYFILVQYVPMYGVILAFKHYSFKGGITGSPWTGLDNFQEMFRLPEFMKVLKNTFIIAFGRLIFEFPVPIIMALLINEVVSKKLKRFYQTVYTFPHFLSWVIISGIMMNFLSDMGVLNQIFQAIGLDKQQWLLDVGKFKGFLFGSNIWKEMGWGTILYLATMAGINPELYEAASIDGANRWHRMKAITWPALQGTVLILLILALGNIMGGAGFDQIYNMDNAAVRESSEVLDTYIYRATFFLGLDFGFTTAVGVFKSGVNAAMLLIAHYIVKSRGHGGLF
ncbi:protein lplB [Paenibacillus pectinilyticus]|uniref:Protein lplB n=1 Tax=Paenibacillus pectinilyticus TaxID=512399 RepID=A0A1C1A3R0_9BACL|nr:ABC transporter permease subunit [Paenibacillus pectinilyticus]OCT15176.1 protein lplB [Paenibacillus pectinilyticus]